MNLEIFNKSIEGIFNLKKYQILLISVQYTWNSRHISSVLSYICILCKIWCFQCTHIRKQIFLGFCILLCLKTTKMIIQSGQKLVSKNQFFKWNILILFPIQKSRSIYLMLLIRKNHTLNWYIKLPCQTELLKVHQNCLYWQINRLFDIFPTNARFLTTVIGTIYLFIQ